MPMPVYTLVLFNSQICLLKCFFFLQQNFFFSADKLIRLMQLFKYVVFRNIGKSSELRTLRFLVSH